MKAELTNTYDLITVLNNVCCCGPEDLDLADIAEREGLTFVEEEIIGYPHARALQNNQAYFIDFGHDMGFEMYDKPDFTIEKAIKHHNDSYND